MECRNHINKNLDKELILQFLQLNKIKTTGLVDIKECSFPVVGRKRGHHNGKDISLVYDEEQTKHEEFDYFTKFYEIEKEYLIEIEGISVKSIREAISREEVSSDFPIRTASFGWSWQDGGHDIKEKWCEIAVRSLYVLGCTCGWVKMGKLANGFGIVLDIHFSSEFFTIPCVATPDAVTMGADLEFTLIYHNEVIPASDFFPIEGEVGCDGRQMERNCGEYALAEIRPKPADSPHEVFLNIKELLKEASDKVPYQDIEFRGGSRPYSGYPCGGHLHFGTPLSLSLLRGLDQYLALPVALVEESYNARKRRKTGFGGLGRYRFKPHGFEYRSLSSWIVEPDLALSILCLAKLILNHHHELPSDFIFDFTVQKAYYNSNKPVLKKIWKQIKSRLMSTSSYPLYQNELSILFNRIEEKRTCQESSDLRKNWGFQVPNQFYEPGMMVRMARKLREKYGFSLGQKVSFHAGERVVQAIIHAHPLSFRDKNALYITPTLRKSLSLPEFWQPRVFLKEDKFSLGPIIGILFSHKFEVEGNLIEHLCQIGREKNILVYVFEPKNINWEEKVISGSVYLEEENIFPFPDAIFDLYSVRDAADDNIDEIRKKLQSTYNIKLVIPRRSGSNNDIFCL